MNATVRASALGALAGLAALVPLALLVRAGGDPAVLLSPASILATSGAAGAALALYMRRPPRPPRRRRRATLARRHA